MSYSRTVIKGQIANWGPVADILQAKLVDDLGVATSCTLDTDSNVLRIISDHLTVTINTTCGAAMTCRDGTTGAWQAYGNPTWIQSVYTTDTAVIILFTTTQAGATGSSNIFVFTKTNNDELAFISDIATSASQLYEYNHALNMLSGDDETLVGFARSCDLVTTQPYSYQVQLHPFMCYSRPNVTSYTPDVFEANFTTIPNSYVYNLYDYILGSYHYLTTGRIWIKYGPV